MTNQQTGRRAAIFLLMMMAVGIPGVLFRGIDSSLVNNPELLNLLIDNAPRMKLSILLSFMAGIFGLGFLITAYPVFKAQRSYLALALLSLWVFQMSIAVVGDIFHFIMIEMAQDTVSRGEGLNEFLPIGAMMAKGYIGAHWLALLGYSGAFCFMNAHLWKFGLLPKWLAAWGVAALGIVFTATVLQLFDKDVPFYAYGQNGVYMMTLSIYLLIKGFREVSD